MTIVLDDPQATERASARGSLTCFRPGDVVALFGGLGAGKTTLCRGVLRGLGHDGDVASPTFRSSRPMRRPIRALPLWHIDLYRTSIRPSWRSWA